MASASRALLLLLTTCHVTGAPLWHQYETANFPSKRASSQISQQCAFAGNSDFYGLGIRIGIYLQWVTSLLANRYLREAIDGSLETNTIFLLAVFVAMVVATAQGTIRSAEVVVVLHLCFGFLFSILSIWGHRTRSTKTPVRFPLLGSFFRLCLATAISAYAIWFWFRGVKSLRGDACDPYTFLFAKVDIAGGARIFFQMVSTLIMVAFGGLFAKEMLMIVFFYCFTVFWSSTVAVISVIFTATSRRGFRHGLFSGTKDWIRTTVILFWSWANGKESSGPNRPDFRFWMAAFANIWIFATRSSVQLVCLLIFKKAPPMGFPPLIRILKKGNFNKDKPVDFEMPQKTADRYLKLKWAPRTLYAVNTLFLIWAIIAVELSLFWNQVTNVYTLNSTGQLIPLIIGIVGLLQLLHGLSVNKSHLTAIDILMGLLDLQPLPITNPDEALDTISISQSSGYYSARRSDDFETFSLHDGTEAIFSTCKPVRRKSLDVVRRHIVNSDRPGSDARVSLNLSRRSTDFQNQKFGTHAYYAAIEPMSLEDLGQSNVEVYKLRDGREVHFVKDHRKWPYHVQLYSRNSDDFMPYVRSSRLRARSVSRIREILGLQGPSICRDRSRSRSTSSFQGSLSSSLEDGSNRSNGREHRNTCGRIVMRILCLPLTLCFVCIRTSPLKDRAKFAKDEFAQRFKTHWQEYLATRKEKQVKETPPRPNNDEIQLAVLGGSSDAVGPPQHNLTSTPPSQWPHRRKKKWITPQVLEAFKRKSFYDTLLRLTEAIANEFRRGKAPKIAADMHRLGDNIREAKRIREERNAGEISAKDQREEVLKRYREIFNQRALKMWLEELMGSPLIEAEMGGAWGGVLVGGLKEDGESHFMSDLGLTTGLRIAINVRKGVMLNTTKSDMASTIQARRALRNLSTLT